MVFYRAIFEMKNIQCKEVDAGNLEQVDTRVWNLFIGWPGTDYNVQHVRPHRTLGFPCQSNIVYLPSLWNDSILKTNIFFQSPSVFDNVMVL